ncbi:MAG TPA: ABC transporter permease [Oscillospiraceae bacterium]|nr:ABC transporter permease [Oscillospiraceae bacterium]HPS75802.1 ABC transporter permease [Oscillospiraceae bacterium]
MSTAFHQAIGLMFSGSALLENILAVTFRMSLASSLIALLLGVPLGILYGSRAFPGRRALVVINRTLMGLPPVVCGLLCYLMFCGVGPLRGLQLLYTVKGMVIAQILLITPIVAGMMESGVSAIAPDIRETALGLGFGGGKRLLLLVNESAYQIITTYLLGLSRALAEVGAVSMVGGAIAYKTNVMTTAIMNYTNMGNFVTALALGIILFALSLLINIAVSILQGRLAK